MERLSLQDLVIATGGRPLSIDSSVSFDRVSIDSREVQPGDLFWALKGERFDGHDFVIDALQKKASFCVISKAHADSVSGPMFVVDDTLQALANLANWYRRKSDALVIGVTGSVGKTTTREMIYSALHGNFQGTRSRRNFNNEIGLPLSLLGIDSQHDFAVVEMGASKTGDIRQLCEIALPEIGVVTAIGPAHLRTFGSLQAIIETKGELIEQLPTNGFVVLPGDDPVFLKMAERASCPVIYVGQGDRCHYRATNVEVFPRNLRFRCAGENFNIPVTGRHVLSNALCAIAIGNEIGLPFDQIARGLEKFIGVPGRCEVLQIGTWTVIDDTYNASPSAVAAACKLLRDLVVPGSNRRLLILGDMCELGDGSSLEHESIGRLAAELCLDRLLVWGNHADDVARGAYRNGMQSHRIVAANDFETLIAVLDCWLESNDLLLVKGSRSTRMERVISWMQERFEYEQQICKSKQLRNCA